MGSESSLLVISPVRNEASHIQRTALALATQTRLPDLWVVVDDGSTDETPRILSWLAARIEFMLVVNVRAPPAMHSCTDRLAVAAEARAFNIGLAEVGWRTFSHVAKLDGDIELPPRYFERLLTVFESEPSIGLAGGILRERDGRRGREDSASDYHVRGALKCYTRDCLQAIGGIQERLGWDTIDEVQARMKGFQTRTLPDLIALHHRTCASAGGILKGAARHGECAYITHSPPMWISARAIRMMSRRPVVLSGAAFFGGYLRAALTKTPRAEEPGFRSFVRGELRARLRRTLGVGNKLARTRPLWSATHRAHARCSESEVVAANVRAVAGREMPGGVTREMPAGPR